MLSGSQKAAHGSQCWKIYKRKLLEKFWRLGGRCSAVFLEGDLRWLVLFGQRILQKIGEPAWDGLCMSGRRYFDGGPTRARGGAWSNV